MRNKSLYLWMTIWVLVPFTLGLLHPQTNTFFVRYNWSLFLPKVFTANSFFTESHIELRTFEGFTTTVTIPGDYKTFPVDDLSFSNRRAVWRIQELPGFDPILIERFFQLYGCRENLFANNLPPGQRLKSLTASYYISSLLRTKPVSVSVECK